MSNTMADIPGAHLIPVVAILRSKLQSQEYELAAVIGSTLLTGLQEWKSSNESGNRMSEALFRNVFFYWLRFVQWNMNFGLSKTLRIF